MIDYKAIARRFRPQLFSEVTGQDVIVKTLINAIKMNKVSHAYLFCGIRGTGKTTLARLFAKSLNCQKRTETCEPCNECNSCREIASGQSLEVIEIDGASNRGIDDIRNINDTLGYASTSGYYKIFIIDEVHMLTKEAFNALLKSLEEPPKRVKFFFATTEPQKVLPTIVSRCQRFDLRRIERAEIIKKLRSIAKELEVEVTDDAFALISRLSEGSLRDSESLFDQLISLGTFPISATLIEESLGLATRSELFEFDEAYESGDMTFAFDLAKRLFTSGRDFFFFIENLLEHYRNIALIHFQKLSINAEHFTEEETQGYEKAIKIYECEKLLYVIDYLADLLAAKNRLSFKKVHLEMTLLHILQSKNRVSIDQIVLKLADLEEQFSNGAPPQKETQESVVQSVRVEKIKQTVQSSNEVQVNTQQQVIHQTVVQNPPVEGKKAPETVVQNLPVEERVIQQAVVQNVTVQEKETQEVLAQSVSVQEDIFQESPAQEETVLAVAGDEEAPREGSISTESLVEKVKPSEIVKQDTIMHFAQVELGGILKKNI